MQGICKGEERERERLRAALAPLRIELSAFYARQTHITCMCDYTRTHTQRSSLAQCKTFNAWQDENHDMTLWTFVCLKLRKKKKIHRHTNTHTRPHAN